MSGLMNALLTPMKFLGLVRDLTKITELYALLSSETSCLKGHAVAFAAALKDMGIHDVKSLETFDFKSEVLAMAIRTHVKKSVAKLIYNKWNECVPNSLLASKSPSDFFKDMRKRPLEEVEQLAAETGPLLNPNVVLRAQMLEMQKDHHAQMAALNAKVLQMEAQAAARAGEVAEPGKQGEQRLAKPIVFPSAATATATAAAAAAATTTATIAATTCSQTCETNGEWRGMGR
jgi:hypothetical protein